MRKYIERENGKPFIWGWDDESIFFVHDAGDLREKRERIQDHPDLLESILGLCKEYFRKREGQ